MKTLVLGGTRFVGKSLVASLCTKGHDVTLFTRGKQPIPDNVKHLKGDRQVDNDLRILLGRSFDVIIDISGRTLLDTKRVLSFTGLPKHRFIYVSSAGVYSKSNLWPIDEEFEIDPKSRHFGKVETERWLIKEQIPFTSFRPTYIYGPGNYNPIEKWFFDRITHNRPVPVPGEGNWITQLGHVSDLAEAMSRCIDIKSAENRIYNCSGKKGITFNGLIDIAAIACNKTTDQISIISFNPSELDPKARKVFPLRIGHFLTDISRVEDELDWSPRYNLLDGFIDSYNNDYLLKKDVTPDFSMDRNLIGV